MNATDEAREALQAAFPDWRIWRTQDAAGPGELMATRRRELSDFEVEAGLARTLPMGHNPDLREQLADQVRREGAMCGRP